MLRQEKQQLQAELEDRMELVRMIRSLQMFLRQVGPSRKEIFALQAAGAHGGLNQSEMLSLDQQRHDDAIKQLHQQVRNSY